MKAEKKTRSARLWRLRELMRLREISSVADLRERLSVQIPYSYYRTRRLVAGDFKELPALGVLDALCYVLRCSILDLVPIDYRKSDAPLIETPRRINRLYRSRKLDGDGHLKRLGDPTGVEPVTIDF